MKFKTFLKVNKRYILTGLSIGGVVLTAIASSSDGIRAERILAKSREAEQSPAKTAIKLVSNYIPTAIVAGSTIATIAVNSNEANKAIGAVAGLAAMAKHKFDEFKAHMPEEEVKKVEDAIVAEKTGTYLNGRELLPGESIIFEPCSEQYFIAKKEDVLAVNLEIVNRYFDDNLVELNYMLEKFQKLDPSVKLDPLGNGVGWDWECNGASWGLCAVPIFDFREVVDQIGNTVQVIEYRDGFSPSFVLENYSVDYPAE